MPVTFTKAPTIAAGDAITSDQYKHLAAAFNDRLRSGLGDPTFRIWYFFLSLFRQVRNPSSGGLWPANAEFFESYQMVEPGRGEWPVAGPGENEGANLASIINAYVFGNTQFNLDDETTRGNTVPIQLPDALPADTDDRVFLLGQLQRGAYDPETGALAAPFYTAARDVLRIQHSLVSPHGNSYGGYIATPTYLGNCGTPSDPCARYGNYQFKFTNLDDSSTKTYAGSCPPTECSAGAVGHVAAIIETGTAYWVWTYAADDSYNLEILPFSEWIEGPYTSNATLQKRTGDGVKRVLQKFAGEYRGSDGQRGEEGYHLEEAFDFQRFFESQHHLSPNIGHENNGVVIPVYPKFQFTASAPSGTLARKANDGNTSYQYHTGFALGSMLIYGSGIAAPVTVKIKDGSMTLSSIVLVPSGQTGEINIMHAWDNAGTVNLSIELESELKLGGGGYLEFTATEQWNIKPEVFDHALLLRLASTRGDALRSMDGRGIDEENSKWISDNYFETGVCLNAHSGGALPPQSGLVSNSVNDNPVFDAARRLSERIRVLNRQNLVGYEVSGGKSILYFERYAYVSGVQLDLFKGIAPSDQAPASGSLIEGIEYEVRGAGTVTYNSQVYSNEQRFTATEISTYETDNALPYEYEGIQANAKKEGLSNEWLMFPSLKPFHSSSSSIWKPESYGDWIAQMNRCHFYAQAVNANAMRHFQHDAGPGSIPGSTTLFSPESPSGYNYTESLNNSPSADFYRSCRIYEPDAEIESALDINENGVRVVKLTFKSRFHHDSVNAPATVDRDINNWTLTDLDNGTQAYRTWDNGIMEYLAWKYMVRTPTVKTGDNEYNSTVQSNPDNPYGSVLPHFFFTRLVRTPYDDGNDGNDAWDTQVVHDEFLVMELYLKAICEGAVDGVTTEGLVDCASNIRLYDFTFENLCVQAFGNRWFSTVDKAIRTDNPQGFGALSNTEMLAKIFNQYSSAVNKLDKFRVPLPFQGWDRKRSMEVESGAVTPQWPEPPSSSCGSSAMIFGASPPGQSGSWGAWTTPATGNPDVASSQAILDCDNATGTVYVIRSNYVEVEYKLEPSDPNAIHAIPETWRDQWNLGSGAGALANILTQRFELKAEIKTVQTETEPCEGTYPYWEAFNSGEGYAFTNVTIENSTVCKLTRAGVLNAGQALGSDFHRTVIVGTCDDASNSTIDLDWHNLTDSYIEIDLVDPS